jgi:hypothetical protein
VRLPVCSALAAWRKTLQDLASALSSDRMPSMGATGARAAWEPSLATMRLLEAAGSPFKENLSNCLEPGVSFQPDEVAQNGPMRSGNKPHNFRRFWPKKIAVSSRQTRVEKSGNERGAEIGGPQIRRLSLDFTLHFFFFFGRTIF